MRCTFPFRTTPAGVLAVALFVASCGGGAETATMSYILGSGVSASPLPTTVATGTTAPIDTTGTAGTSGAGPETSPAAVAPVADVQPEAMAAAPVAAVQTSPAAATPVAAALAEPVVVASLASSVGNPAVREPDLRSPTSPAATAPLGDAPSPTALLGSSAGLSGLGHASANPTGTTTGVGAVSHCMRGYAPPASLIHDSPLDVPAGGGVFFTPAELAAWRQRIANGPFIRANDYTAGSPGDWGRIVANAKALATQGEPPLTGTTPHSTFSTHGTWARDAAFYELITADGTLLPAVRAHLLAQAANPALDFPNTLCITSIGGATGDAWFAHASWLMRYVVTYDYVRRSLARAERVTIENFVRRNAHFLAAHNDWGLATVFPSRMLGNYDIRSSAAAASTDAAKWYTRRYDTNADCSIDARDPAASYPAYAYVHADGTTGPRISVLSQYYNNRRSVAASAYGAAGILLGDADLIASAKRYFMEWLAYGVWADGSQGEYARNGDYCIASQGVIYGALNIQGAAALSRLLARQGDTTLPNFSTTTGLFGTESSGTGTGKSIALAIATYFRLVNGQLDWHYHEGWKASQAPRGATSMGGNQVHYMGAASTMVNYHELGLLPAAAQFPNLPISGWVLRDRSITPLEFPGASGSSVSTGYGSWTDGFNSLPAVLLLHT